MTGIVVKDEEGVFHIRGGGMADTSTLCGMFCEIMETKPKPITCNGCRDLARAILDNAKAIEKLIKP